MIGFLAFWDSVVMSRYKTASPRPAQAPAPIAEPTMKTSVAGTADEKTDVAMGPEDKLVVLQAEGTKVSILSRGARVASWQVQERDHWIELIEPEKIRTVSPLETFPSLNFSIDKKSDSEAAFTAMGPDGIRITKTLRLLSKPPFHEISISFSNPTKAGISVQSQLSLGNGIDKHVVGSAYDSKETDSLTAETRVVAFGTLVKSWKPGFIFQRTIDTNDSGPFEWAGVDNHHFMTAFISEDKNISSVKVVADRKSSPVLFIPINVTVKPGETVSSTYKLYFGPKNYSELKKLGHNLDRMVDFGFFGPISKILLATLKFFKNMTGNYGWAIILLTFCIQILVFPLTRKNLQHSLRMKDLQPQLKKLQEQFKSDPKRLQAETFNLYKKNGMKFMGMEGCFPMLLQLPVFFAFYSTLNVAYELRGAPWIFWIHNLGAHDPYYVLPIIMGGGMFLQQKLTAVAADPTQARMMMFMPVIFTFMFLKLPAGLVLYWCVNSLTTIGIQKFLHSPPKSTPQPRAT